ncbi:MAG: VanZ family protein [Fidelibacterota bacterium]
MNAAKYRVITTVYAFLILAVSTIPGRTVQDLIFGWDKAFHFLEYAVLGGLLVKSLTHRDQKRIASIVTGGLLFAAVDESWQAVISERDASVYDWIADTLGVAAGIALLLVWIVRPRLTGDRIHE